MTGRTNSYINLARQNRGDMAITQEFARKKAIHDTNYPGNPLFGVVASSGNLAEGKAKWISGDSGIEAAAEWQELSDFAKLVETQTHS